MVRLGLGRLRAQDLYERIVWVWVMIAYVCLNVHSVCMIAYVCACVCVHVV